MRIKRVDNGRDYLDSRDIMARIEELEDQAEDGPLDEEDAAELKALKDFAEEGSGYSDWDDGATLIRDSYFEDYARELADEMGAISRDPQWPYGCIDWKAAAEELQQDYTSIDFDGVTYWVR